MNRAEKRRQKKLNDKATRISAGKIDPFVSPEIQQALSLAVSHHTGGRFGEAEALYRQVLQSNPDQPDALHLLGVLAHQSGQDRVAAQLISKALTHKPRFSEAHYNLGRVFTSLGQLNKTIENFEKAIKYKPDYAEAHFNLGIALRNAGQMEEAVASYQEAIHHKPDYSDAFNNLGLSLQEMGKLNDAVDNYKKTIALSPKNSGFHYNLGTAYQALRQFGKAVECHKSALALHPQYVEAHNNLGISLNNLGQLEDAVDSYNKAITINADYPEAHINLGNILQQMGRFQDAKDSLNQAITVAPKNEDAWFNLGNVCKELIQLSEAVACYEKAITIKPDYPEALNNLGRTFKALGRLDDALICYNKILSFNPDYAKAHSNLLFTLNYISDLPETEILEKSRAWGAWVAAKFKAPSTYNNDRSPDRILRVGYVSPDMKIHSVAFFFEPLLAAHNSMEIESYCYAEVHTPDAMTKKLQKHADHWHWTSMMNDDELAAIIKQDNIDILLDLSGHTAGNRQQVFARKPAPVQMTWLGYPNTTGLKAMDYRIVDAMTDSIPSASETLVYLPGGFLCYSPPDIAPPISPAPSIGAPIFGSFNNAAKLSTRCIEIWSRILSEVPEARLLLKSAQLSDATACETYRNRFAVHGITSDRIELRGEEESLESHLNLYAKVNVCLDPMPYNGTTTTFEALWMGVPVVTLRGEHHRSRVGTSILTRAGLDDYIAANEDEYVSIAISLVRDAKVQKDFRLTMRERMAPLCDALAFARDMETAYRIAWKKWCNT